MLGLLDTGPHPPHGSIESVIYSLERQLIPLFQECALSKLFTRFRKFLMPYKVFNSLLSTFASPEAWGNGSSMTRPDHHPYRLPALHLSTHLVAKRAYIASFAIYSECPFSAQQRWDSSQINQSHAVSAYSITIESYSVVSHHGLNLNTRAYHIRSTLRLK